MMESSGKKVVLLVFLLLVFIAGKSDSVQDSDQLTPSKEDRLLEGFIYYADTQLSSLRSVKKRFAANLDSHQLALEIIRAVVAGPPVSGLHPTWPKEATVNAFFITDDKKGIVDLRIDKDTTAYMDTQAELLAVYSMVNSLTVNIPEIEMVKILINGKDAETLAGHIDLKLYYKTNMLIVK